MMPINLCNKNKKIDLTAKSTPDLTAISTVESTPDLTAESTPDLTAESTAIFLSISKGYDLWSVDRKDVIGKNFG